ncbi:MAG: thiamine diphosphokinase [Deltaproteobacteria bacterium]|nr:thiamine diphosphokinase [Deltaproteobacteria bacterium]
MIYIFLNGEFNQPVDLPPYPGQSTLVVAVDGGAVHCLKLGWPIHVLIGDLDSLPKNTLSKAKKANKDMETILFGTDKDQTDFELALDYVTSKFPSHGRIEVLGSLGGRWDMTLSNLILPFSDRHLAPLRQASLPKGHALASPLVTFRDGYWVITLLSGPGWTVINPMPIDRRVSLIPISPTVTKVRLSGDFKYPLDDDELVFGLTRGISNELGPHGGSVFIGTGLLIVTVSPLLMPGPIFKKAPEAAITWKTPSGRAKSPKKAPSAPAAKPSAASASKPAAAPSCKPASAPKKTVSAPAKPKR